MKNSVGFMLLALFALLQSGCSDDEIVIAEPDYECEVGDTLRADLGATYTISLLAGITSGYRWEIQKGFDERYVELESYSIVDPDPDSEIDGRPMFQEWTYQARRQGIVCCTLIYTCVSEENPISTKNIVVIIE
jgi:predicted secreted protein